MDDDYPIPVNPYSPLRVWLYTQLSGLTFSADGLIRDNQHGFYDWTKMTHADCMNMWAIMPGFTTCTSFLQHVHNHIKEADKNKDKYKTLHFAPFALDKCGKNKGWHTLGEENQQPDDGDFYQTAVSGETKHVGVLFRVFGGVCTVIGGGADKKNQYGAIKKSTIPFPPNNLLGWLNIEEFYADWNGPDA